MSCIIGHRWSKYHIVETYTNNLAQVRVCKNCGELGALAVPISMCKQEQVKMVWDKYHFEDAIIPVSIKLNKSELIPMNEVSQ